MVELVAQRLDVHRTPDSSRTARIEARIAPDALTVVRRAAEIQGRSLHYIPRNFVLAAIAVTAALSGEFGASTPK